MKSSIALSVLVLSGALSGCADKLLSDDRLRDTTSMTLGVPVTSISGRQYDGLTNTYYQARTAHGSYRCSINGGGVLAMGLTNPPTCGRL